MRAFLSIIPRQAQHREDRLRPLCAQKQGSPTPYSPSLIDGSTSIPPFPNTPISLSSSFRINNWASCKESQQVGLLPPEAHFAHPSLPQPLWYQGPCPRIHLSRIDYYNYKLAGLPDKTIAPLWRVQNAAARFTLRKGRSTSTSHMPSRSLIFSNINSLSLSRSLVRRSFIFTTTTVLSMSFVACFVW